MRVSASAKNTAHLFNLSTLVSSLKSILWKWGHTHASPSPNAPGCPATISVGPPPKKSDASIHAHETAFPNTSDAYPSRARVVSLSLLLSPKCLHEICPPKVGPGLAHHVQLGVRRLPYQQV